jgi:hypothetical protein
MRTQFTRFGIDDLEFFFDTNSEPVIHARPFPVRSAGTPRVFYPGLVESRQGLQKRFAADAEGKTKDTAKRFNTSACTENGKERGRGESGGMADLTP